MSPSVPAARAPLSPGVKAWLIVAAAASFVAFLAAVAFQPELTASSDPGAHAQSRSPAGYAGLVRLLRADGVAVRFNRRATPGPEANGEVLLVLTPRPSTPPDELKRLAKGRRVLLIPAKWLVAPSPDHPGRVVAIGRWPLGLAAGQAADALDPEAPSPTPLVEGPAAAAPVVAKAPANWRDPLWKPQPLRAIESLRTFSGAGVQPQMVDAQEHILVAMAPKGLSYAVADADLLNNRALKQPEGARTAVSLVEDLANGAPVVFDLTLAGVAGSRSPLRSAFSPRFLPATLAALLSAAVLGLMAAERFGALQRPGRAYAFGKRALVDTTASLLAVASREPRLAGRYADLARASAAHAVGLLAVGPPAGGGSAQVDAALDRIGRERGAGEWSPLAAEAKTITRQAALMAFARRVHAWRAEMTLGRG